MSTDHLIARPEHVLLAAVAYTRPQMLTLDELIASQSAQKSTLALPTELLLHVRSDLQQSLISQLADEAAASLFEYESALLEGICADCFWWYMDMHGPDVWNWVEQGYRGACACLVAGESFSDSSAASAIPARVGRPRSLSDIKNGLTSRSPSAAKRRILATFSGVEIETRGQWLRTYISRTYFGGERAWAGAKRVLSDLGCSQSFERVALPTPPSSHSAPRHSDDESHSSATASLSAAAAAPPAPTTAETLAVAHVNGPERSELKKTSQHRASRACDFGALIRISQASNGSSQQSDQEEPAVTLNRVARELCLRPFADDSGEPRIPLECSATRFVDQVYKRNACATHFISQRHPEASCEDCTEAATGAVVPSFGLLSVFSWGFSTLASTAAGAMGVAYLASRAINGLSA